MATPPFAIQNVNASVSTVGATGTTIQANTVPGVAVNISSGYTAKILVNQASNANPAASPVDITADCGFTYGTTGLLTIAFAATAGLALPGQSCNAAVYLSNDAGTTESLLATGTISIPRSEPAG
jgi:hypothetical protein